MKNSSTTSSIPTSHSNVVYLDKRREAASMAARHATAASGAVPNNSFYPYAVAAVALAGGAYLYVNRDRENPLPSLPRLPKVPKLSPEVSMKLDKYGMATTRLAGQEAIRRLTGEGIPLPIAMVLYNEVIPQLGRRKLYMTIDHGVRRGVHVGVRGPKKSVDKVAPALEAVGFKRKDSFIDASLSWSSTDSRSNPIKAWWG